MAGSYGGDDVWKIGGLKEHLNDQLSDDDGQ